MAKHHFNEDSFSTTGDRPHLWPSQYNYEYLDFLGQSTPNSTKEGRLHAFPALLANPAYAKSQLQYLGKCSNSIQLLPKEAGLAWHSSLVDARQSKHWKAAVDTAIDLFEHIAADELAQGTRGKSGISYSDIAKIERARVEHGWIRFGPYMCPSADEERTRLISAAMVWVFVFDEKWEVKTGETVQEQTKDFISWLRGDDGVNSALQNLNNALVERFHAQDRVQGNGGAEVIETLIEFILHSDLPSKTLTLDEYLDYRATDSAYPMVVALAKFAIGSSVDFSVPKFDKIRKLTADHIGLANDQSSYDKEKRSFDEGRSRFVINAVEVVRNTITDGDTNMAKLHCFLEQMKVEQQIYDELERLRTGVPDTVNGNVVNGATTNDEEMVGLLTKEEWKLVDAMILSITGNMMTSLTTCRYGGEVARIPGKGITNGTKH